MKIESTPETFKLKMDGEILLSPNPAPRNMYVGEYSDFARPPASIDVTHNARNTLISFTESASVIGPPQTLKHGLRLVWKVVKWCWAMRTQSNESDRRHAWVNPAGAIEGTTYTPMEFVRRAVHASKPQGLDDGYPVTELPRWAAIKRTFGVGSTYAKALCRRFGLDPWETVYRPGHTPLDTNENIEG